MCNCGRLRCSIRGCWAGGPLPRKIAVVLFPIVLACGSTGGSALSPPAGCEGVICTSTSTSDCCPSSPQCRGAWGPDGCIEGCGLEAEVCAPTNPNACCTLFDCRGTLLPGGQCQPGVEFCDNGEDDNCDGATDEPLCLSGTAPTCAYPMNCAVEPQPECCTIAGCETILALPCSCQ